MSLPESLTLQLNARVNLELRLIPAGEFRMGSRGYAEDEEPIHLVRITRPFYLGATPVTQAQWRAVVEAHPSCGLIPNPSYYKSDYHSNRDTYPVERVNWFDCSKWCRVLNENYELTLKFPCHVATHDQLRDLQIDVPTEAQWEYACRLSRDSAGLSSAIETDYHTGDGEAALATVGWYVGNSGYMTHKVVDGQFRPTNFGLYSMHGNVKEWCRDTWDANAYKKRADGVPDPFVDSHEQHDD